MTYFSLLLKPGESSIVKYLTYDGPIKEWDEFNPSLYQLNESIKSGSQLYIASTSFAFRTLSSDGVTLLINNKPLFLRGMLECNIFP
ncbi:hypothetical protein AQ505_16310 [Pedobacter sp. PACM 27299]|uniref:hypothetical protein n=1 Tax=Pedobacter sp. PACM 27299 TaxID=1727164 RepID=UPI000706D315|nr:hypothetical protein [Pedobacter sp. PACM 27299]ALL06916.1 hypothetical protein AQ505_16310 [Pedobacter sp. PACM 27299]